MLVRTWVAMNLWVFPAGYLGLSSAVNISFPLPSVVLVDIQKGQQCQSPSAKIEFCGRVKMNMKLDSKEDG